MKYFNLHTAFINKNAPVHFKQAVKNIGLKLDHSAIKINAITSRIKIFADDSVLYRNIRNRNYHVIIKNDQDMISS